MPAIAEYHDEEIRARLIEHLRETLCVGEPLTPQTDLVMAGALDSLMIIDLVAYTEQTFQVRIEPGDISPQNFRTVETLSRLIIDKRSARAADCSPSGQVIPG